MKSPILRPRTRLISLRMTEQEYEKILEASAEQGARCVSDFARDALMNSARPEHPQSRLTERAVDACEVWNALDQRILRLEQRIDRLAERRQCRCQSVNAQPCESSQ